MPGSTMSGNLVSGAGALASTSTSSHPAPPLNKRPSLCSALPSSNSNSGVTAPHHRRSSLQHNSLSHSTNNIVSKQMFKDFVYKDKKEETNKTHIDSHRSTATSSISRSDDKLVVVRSAAESGSNGNSLPSTPNRPSSSGAQNWSSNSSSTQQSPTSDAVRPRTPVDDQRMLVPDSTTSQLEGKQSYSKGDDVFVKQKDGRYYLGTVKASSPSGERWLVRFGDETERWAEGCDLRPLGMGCDEGEGSVLCVVCKVRGPSGEVVACDQCGRGYHGHCHSPDNDAMSPPTGHIQGIAWQCKRCVEQRVKEAASENRALRREMLKNQRQIVKPPVTLPYNMNTLQWDAHHRENMEGKYCYCGESGNWLKKMLQCVRCRQWFHQKCISCLRLPMYTGDRFYIFACSLCNYGKEFVRRLELQWVDLVHLMLFNLTAHNNKKYFDLDSVIVPYIKDNWHILQLSEAMQNVIPSQRRDMILKALSTNENRFKCGRETKKRAGIWGLRSKDPPAPPPPSTPLPTRGPLTEDVLTNRLAFIPVRDSSNSSQDSREQCVTVSTDIMTGRRFQDNSISSDNDSLRSSPSPIDSIINRSRLNSDKSDIFSIKRDSSSPYSFDKYDKFSTPIQGKELKFYEMNFQGHGFVKKSVPFPKMFNKRKNFLDALKRNCKVKDTIKQEQVEKCPKLLRNRVSKQQKPVLKTHMSIGTNTPPVEDKTVFTLLDSRTNINNSFTKNSKDSSLYSFDTTKREVILPPTPPTSVSAPPTPPATAGGPPSSSCSSNDVPPDFQQQKKSILYDSDHENNKSEQSNSSSDNNNAKIAAALKTPTKNKNKDSLSSSPKKDKTFSPLKTNFTNGHNSKIAAINLEISKLSTKNIIEHSKIMSLHHINEPYSIFKVEHDSSGDDTSSRGTLDSIIPPPANFQGKNNPFHWHTSSNHKNLVSKLLNRHSLSKLQGVATNTNGSMKNQRISLPVNLNPIIGPPVRPLKRHLSVEDLVIGPNGEVKRRRLRRPRKALKNPLNQNTKDQTMTERQKTLRSSYGQEDLNKSNINSDVQQTSANTTTTTVNIEVNIQQLNTCIEYTQNGRTLRQRQEKNYCDSRRGSTSSNNANILPGNTSLNISGNNSIGTNSSGVRSLNLSPQKSPFKNNPSSSAADATIEKLKNSVHSYFGALNRIGSGEKFTLMGKRLMENGNVQYLIEWDGHGS